MDDEVYERWTQQHRWLADDRARYVSRQLQGEQLQSHEEGRLAQLEKELNSIELFLMCRGVHYEVSPHSDLPSDFDACPYPVLSLGWQLYFERREAEHHPLCNFFIGPRDNCDMCRAFFNTYGDTPVEVIMTRDFPDAVRRV